ncbi:MAG: Hsp20/alpha crystallin family protein [Burkholderiales bacterium]|nr:Hsp20/alpha crystallin family protein [Bacteroidia bacterium]
MTLLKKRNGNGSHLFPSLADAFFSNKFLTPDFDFGDFGKGLQMPPANILEKETEFRIDLSSPGLKRSDFKVEVDNGDLVISSEKKDEDKEETENYMRRQFSYSSFCRRFPLPDNAQDEKISAKYDNGMLHITISKKEITATKVKKAIEVA